MNSLLSDDWQSVALNPPKVGDVINVTFIDRLGLMEATGEYFLNDDGKFYLIDPPTEVVGKVAYWRSAVKKFPNGT